MVMPAQRAHSRLQEARAEQLFHDARTAVETNLTSTTIVPFDKLRLVEVTGGAYVCGKVWTKRREAPSFVHRNFIYSSPTEILLLVPATRAKPNR